jgi:hypothetical protein
MRFWICDISSSDAESRFEMDFEEPPAEGSVIAPGILVYKVSAVVRLPSELSPGVIEVERLNEPPPIRGVGGPSSRPAPTVTRTVFKGLRVWRRKRRRGPTREELAAQEQEVKRILYAQDTITVRRGRR